MTNIPAVEKTVTAAVTDDEELNTLTFLCSNIGRRYVR